MKTFLIPLQGLFGMSKSSLHISHLNVRTDAAVATVVIRTDVAVNTCMIHYLDVRTGAAVYMFMIRSQGPFRISRRMQM